MIDIEDARQRWNEEREVFENFATLVAARSADCARAVGVWCETSSRAKETHSLVKKLLKGKHTYEELPDRAGARCVVRYLSDLLVVLDAIDAAFECANTDSKLDGLRDYKVGYISTHVSVRLRADDPEAGTYPPDRFWAELQVRTLGQHLWAEMAHDSIYKNDEALSNLPLEFRRRVNLMAGLIEVADQEFNRLNQEIPVESAVELYRDLERHYFTLTGKRPDAELSLDVIRLLLPLYGDGPPQISAQIEAFFKDHEEDFNLVYEQAKDVETSAFLYQPEAIMIFERLEFNQEALRRVWATQFPESELERFANAFGISFD